MSWGTYYRHEGYLSRIGKDEIEEQIDECDGNIARIFREMLALMAMTPPAYAKDCEGNEYPWAEHIAQLAKNYQEELEDAIALRTRLYDCQEVMREHPENVEEG